MLYDTDFVQKCQAVFSRGPRWFSFKRFLSFAPPFTNPVRLGMQVAFGVFLLGYFCVFCVLLGCFFAYAAKPNLPGLGSKINGKNGKLNSPVLTVDIYTTSAVSIHRSFLSYCENLKPYFCKSRFIIGDNVLTDSDKVSNAPDNIILIRFYGAL